LWLMLVMGLGIMLWKDARRHERDIRRIQARDAVIEFVADQLNRPNFDQEKCKLLLLKLHYWEEPPERGPLPDQPHGEN